MKSKSTLFAALFSMAFSQAVLAQDFEVSPSDFTFNVIPGSLMSRDLYITNHSNQKATFNIRIEDFDYDEDGKRHKRQRGTVPYSCAQWVSVSPSTFDVDPNSQKSLRVTMSVPGDAREARWAQLVISQRGERTSMYADNNGASLTVSPEIVVDVIQSPKDFTDNRAVLSSFVELDTDGTDNRLFNVTITNQGRAIIKGRLYVVAVDMSGSDFREYEIMKTNVTVMTGATLKVPLTLTPSMLPVGDYDFTCLFDMGPQIPLKGIKLKKNVSVN